MKVRRNIYLIIGTILVVVNLFTDLMAVLEGVDKRYRDDREIITPG